MKFRKKPVVIEAVKFDPLEKPSHTKLIRQPVEIQPRYYWKCNVYADSTSKTGYSIDTLEGKHEVTPGDWIITGVKGERYPCKPDIFEMTYEKVDE